MAYIGSPAAPTIATVSDDTITSAKIDSTSTGMTFADLTVDTNTLVVDETNNRVGIGISSPSARLHVSNDQGGGFGRILLDANVSSGYETRIEPTDTGFEFTTKSTIRPFIFQTDSPSTEQMRIANSGAVTTPNQPAFWAYCTGLTSINVNSGTQVQFNTEKFDIGSNFNTSTYTFTAPVTGKYFLSAGCRIDDLDTASSYYRIRLVTTNGESGTIVRPLFTADVAYFTRHIASVFDMDANDTAQVNILQSGGHTTSHVDDGIVYTWFTGYLLG